jgi:hypothetical protein
MLYKLENYYEFGEVSSAEFIRAEEQLVLKSVVCCGGEKEICGKPEDHHWCYQRPYHVYKLCTIGSSEVQRKREKRKLRIRLHEGSYGWFVPVTVEIRRIEGYVVMNKVIEMRPVGFHYYSVPGEKCCCQECNPELPPERVLKFKNVCMFYWCSKKGNCEFSQACQLRKRWDGRTWDASPEGSNSQWRRTLQDHQAQRSLDGGCI